MTKIFDEFGNNVTAMYVPRGDHECSLKLIKEQNAMLTKLKKKEKKTNVD